MAGTAVLLVAGLSVILAAPGHSQAVQEGAIAALFVAAAGTVVVLVRRPRAGGPDLAALVVTGLAGAALAGLLPQTQAYLIGYLALAGRRALPAVQLPAGAGGPSACGGRPGLAGPGSAVGPGSRLEISDGGGDRLIR